MLHDPDVVLAASEANGRPRLGGPMLIVVSAPSGAGKTTLCHSLLARYRDLAYSVSCTTRPPRGHEQDGRDYIFLTRAEFDSRVAAGAFLEHADVHGHGYGTLRATVLDALERGQCVLLDIDVQGAAQVREALRRGALGVWADAWLDVFIAPPSMAALRERLERRGEDALEVIERRLRNAALEMREADCYKYSVVNDRIACAYDELCRLLEGEAARIQEGRKP